MGLPDFVDKLTHSSAKEEKEYFLALEIWEGGVKSAIWTVDEGRSKVVALGSREVWENGEDELVAAADKSLAIASERFTGEAKEPSRVIFGLTEDWTKENKILPDSQHLLSHVCEKLELKPAGFVSIFDALVRHLGQVEGSPPTAILIGPQREFVWLAGVEAGRIKGIQKVARSENLAADVYEGLLRLSGLEIFPSRMLLYDGEDLESQRQVLLSHSWLNEGIDGKKLPFLHLPKIEILPLDFDITAIAIAGGSEVAKSLGLEVVSEKEGVVEESVVQKEDKEEEAEEVQQVDLGFVRGRDVKETILEEVAPVAETVSPEEVSYGQNKVPLAEEVNEMVSEEQEGKRRLRFIMPKLSFSLPFFSLPRLHLGWKIAVVLFLLILALGTTVGWAFLYLPKAEVIIYVSPRFLEKEVELTVDPNQEAVDTKNNIIPGAIIEVEKEGEKTTTTTGEKTVGEKAKGEIIAYNRTDTQKTFSQGTVLVGPGGLRFTLEREVSVASKTPDLISGVDKWGESRVVVTAIEIGAPYNLAPKSQFSFKDFPLSSFLAKNESAFAGGTSRQIPSVSGKDQESLLKSLTEELSEEGRREIGEKGVEGVRVIEDLVSIVQVSATYNHKVGDEAQDLTLKLKLRVKALSFKGEEFNSFSQSILSDVIPVGYEFRKQEVESSFEVKKKNDDGSIIFKAKISANLLPEIDEAELTKVIKGKSKSQATDFLRTNTLGYKSSEIMISPNILPRFQLLPRNKSNIKIEIRSG